MTLPETIEAAERLAASLGRDDILGAIQRAHRRLERDVVTIAVAGDFKAGKTSLVNGLLGRRLLPVDADLATAVPTLVRAGADGMTVHRSGNGESRREAEPIETIDSWISEQANPGDSEGVDLVEISLDNPLLSAGVALVDTPGLGGLNAAQREATLHFLSMADALLFVSDGASPLDRVEIEFLRAASELVPFGLVVVSRIDLHPEWKRIVDAIESALQAEEVGMSVIGVSSLLRDRALRDRDTVLNGESGFPDLLARLSTLKNQRSEFVGRRIAADVLKALEILALGIEEPGGIDPEAGVTLAKQRQRNLSDAAARVPGSLQDAFADLRSEADYATRAALRSFSQTAESRIDEIDPANDWSLVIEEAMAGLTADLRAVLEGIDRQATETGNLLANLLGEESGLAPEFEGEFEGISAKSIEEPTFDRPSLFSTGFQTLRGAQSGLILIGMVAKLSGLAALLPVSLGVGLVFGVRQLGEERKRQLERRRQEARKVVRVLTTEVSAETTRLVQDRIRDRHRMVRDRLQTLAEAVQRSTTEAVRRAEGRLALARSEPPLADDPLHLLDDLRERLREAAR